MKAHFVCGINGPMGSYQALPDSPLVFSLGLGTRTLGKGFAEPPVLKAMTKDWASLDCCLGPSALSSCPTTDMDRMPLGCLAPWLSGFREGRVRDSCQNLSTTGLPFVFCRKPEGGPGTTSVDWTSADNVREVGAHRSQGWPGTSASGLERYQHCEHRATFGFQICLPCSTGEGGLCLSHQAV